MGLQRVQPLSWMAVWQKDQKKSCKRNRLQDFFVAPRVGLEPTTARLTAACSTDWAIEDYNKNTVLSLDYVSGTFLVPSKLHIVSFIPQSWTCSWYSGIIIAFVPTLRCYCLFAVIHIWDSTPASSTPLRGVIHKLASLVYFMPFPTQMPVCSFNQPLKILFMAAFFRRPTPSFLFGQALDLLVTVSSMCYHTSTSALSTLSSSRGLTGLTPGISYLKGGFTLRCLQRLSLPDLATLLCHWYDNRWTSGSSSPVLSY